MSDTEFEFTKENFNRLYHEWYTDFQAAKQEFDAKLDEIHAKYEKYIDCVGPAIVAQSYEEFVDHAHEIHTCEPYPEEEDILSCAVFTEDGKMIGMSQFSVDELHELALQYIDEDSEESEIEDTDEYFFTENA